MNSVQDYPKMSQQVFSGTYRDFGEFYHRLKKEHVSPETAVTFVVETTKDKAEPQDLELDILHPLNRKWLNSEIQKGVNSLDAGKGKVMKREDFEERRKQRRAEYIAQQ